MAAYIPSLFSLLTIVGSALQLIDQRRPTAARRAWLQPAVSGLLLLLVAVAPAPPSLIYKSCIFLGLLLILLRDALTLAPGNPPVIDNALRVVSYLLFLMAFTAEAVLQLPTIWTVPLLLGGAGIFAWLWPKLGTLRETVGVFALLLFFMAWQALEMAVQTGQIWSWLAAAGAISLVLTECVRGVDFFRRPFAAAAPLALGLYLLGMWLVALSVWADLLWPL